MMLRGLISVGTALNKHLPLTEFVGINSVVSQTIRWKRKPIWLPPAKSKLFKVRPRRQYPEEEEKELRRLWNEYRTARTTIRLHLMKTFTANQVLFDEETLKLAEDQDYAKCMSLNDEWNKNVAKSREIRLQKKWADRELEVLQNIEAKKKRDAEIMESIEDKVRKTKIEAKTFITRDNIDKAIEEALANVVNYNAAIDMQGNKYVDNPINQQQIIQQ